jgi:2-polyprenyl-3-methyl-5-hydroxy-6-metoxy-1,4-benzoquinol methylase
VVKNPYNQCSPNVVNGLFRNQLETFIRFSPEFSNKDPVLDIGCGWGGFLKKLKLLGYVNLTGVENSDKSLETARRDNNLSEINFVVADGLNLPFPSNSFKVVTCWEVLEHLPSGTECDFFEEVARVLMPGGLFMLSTPLKDFRSYLFDPAAMFGHRHYKHHQIREFAAKAPLIEKFIQVVGGYRLGFYILSMYVSKWMFGKNNFLDNFPNFQRQMNQESNRTFMNIVAVMKKEV